MTAKNPGGLVRGVGRALATCELPAFRVYWAVRLYASELVVKARPELSKAVSVPGFDYRYLSRVSSHCRR